MKLISLNAWGGRVHKPLLGFLKGNQETDIFCFQEIYKDAGGKETIYLDAELGIYEDIENSLPSHTGLYHPHLRDYYGLATFVKEGIEVTKTGEQYVHREKGYIPTAHIGHHAKNVSFVEVNQ